MPIRDAIQEANCIHEIFFLLTAYVEAVGYCDKLNLLPWQMRDLPLAGVHDVKMRIFGLQLRLQEVTSDPNQGDRLVIEEAMTTFSVALRRLASLQDDGGELLHAA